MGQFPSLWETKVYADIYNREVYPKVEKMVEKYIAGVPIVKNFEAEYSTFHKIAIAATVRFLSFRLLDEEAKLAPSFIGACSDYTFELVSISRCRSVLTRVYCRSFSL